MKATNSRWDLILWDGTRSISPTVRVRKLSWTAPGEAMDGMTGLIPGFLDKSVCMNVLGESHGRRERQGGAFYTHSQYLRGSYLLMMSRLGVSNWQRPPIESLRGYAT